MLSGHQERVDHLRASRLIEKEAAGTRQLIFLGTGTSTGVPMIGCDCHVCTSSDPRNQRTRPSVLMSFPGGNLLIDTTPEMRMQLLRERVRLVHAITFTHAHADHLFGLDDARLFPHGSADQCRFIANTKRSKQFGAFLATHLGRTANDRQAASFRSLIS